MTAFPRALLAVPLMLIVAACSTAGPGAGIPFFSMGATKTDEPSLPPDASARERVARAVSLLGKGRSDEARGELKQALAKSPADATARSLLQQIDTDPVQLLGQESSDYVVAPGDTMSVLADRFLGDPMMFYGLARYNNLASPDMLTVGKTLRMPARGSKTQGPDLAASSSVSPSAPSGPQTPAAAAKANTLRLRGLEALNTGDAALAVALLRQAAAANASDPAIQQDLQRAIRIQGAMGNE